MYIRRVDIKKRKAHSHLLDLPNDCICVITNYLIRFDDFFSFILTCKTFYNLSKSQNFFGFSNVRFNVSRKRNHVTNEEGKHEILKFYPKDVRYCVKAVNLGDNFEKEELLKYLKCFPRLSNVFIGNSVDILTSNEIIEAVKDVKELWYALTNVSEASCFSFEKMRRIERIIIFDYRENKSVLSFSEEGLKKINHFNLKNFSLSNVVCEDYNFLTNLPNLESLFLELNTLDNEYCLRDSNFSKFFNLKELEISLFSQNELTNDMFKYMKKIKQISCMLNDVPKINFSLLKHVTNVESFLFIKKIFQPPDKGEIKLIKKVPKVGLCLCKLGSPKNFDDYVMRKCTSNDELAEVECNFHFFCKKCNKCQRCDKLNGCAFEYVICQKCIKTVCLSCERKQCRSSGCNLKIEERYCVDCLEMKVCEMCDNLLCEKCIFNCSVCSKTACIPEDKDNSSVSMDFINSLFNRTSQEERVKEICLYECNLCKKKYCVECCDYFVECEACDFTFCRECVDKKEHLNNERHQIISIFLSKYK